MTHKIVKQIKWPWSWPLTLIWPWPWVWHLTLTIWICFFQNCWFLKLCDVKTWHHTSKWRRETECSLLDSIGNIFQPARLRPPVPKLWLKMWFIWFLMCLTLTLTYQVHLIFENSPFVPLHDWCKFRRDILINSGDIAHWNMKKITMLYNGNFSLPWKRMLYVSDRCIFLQGTSHTSNQYVYTFWEQSVDNWRF